MASLTEVLSVHAPLCLNCLLKRTGGRVGDVLHEVAATPAVWFDEGRCPECTELGPVIARHRS